MGSAAGKIVKGLAYGALAVAIVSPFVIFNSPDSDEPVSNTKQASSSTNTPTNDELAASSPKEHPAKQSAAKTPEQSASVAKEDKSASSADSSPKQGAKEQDHTDAKLAAVQESVVKEEGLSAKDQAKLQANLSTDSAATKELRERVATLQKQQTAEQKKAYAQSIKDRQEQVDAAVASIANNSRVYLPPMLSSRALVVYFSVLPVFDMDENTTKELADNIRADATSGATKIDEEEHPVSGIQYIAEKIKEETGSDIYNISTVTSYPRASSKLYEFALEEQTNNKVPEITDDIPLNLKNYDTIYLCYQNWWRDMPAAIYSFLDKYDLSGKTIVPICFHSGDGFSDTISSIATREPHAQVYSEGLLISKQDLKDDKLTNTMITSWLQRLSDYFNN